METGRDKLESREEKTRREDGGGGGIKSGRRENKRRRRKGCFRDDNTLTCGWEGGTGEERGGGDGLLFGQTQAYKDAV